MNPIRPDLFRIDFRPELFAQLLKVHGKRMKWSKSSACPNTIGGDIDEHNINCNLCDGSGFIYYDEKEIRALAQSIGVQHVFRAEGRFDMGTMMITTPAEVEASLWDKMKLIDSFTRYRENLKRITTGLIDRPRYDILKVNQLRSRDTIFICGQHFKITNGQIEWLSLTTIPVGTVYSLDYTHHPVYILIDGANVIRDARTKDNAFSTDETYNLLPKRFMAKQDFILRDESKDVRK